MLLTYIVYKRQPESKNIELKAKLQADTEIKLKKNFKRT
jgi:hypothetical protein